MKGAARMNRCSVRNIVIAGAAALGSIGVSPPAWSQTGAAQPVKKEDSKIKPDQQPKGHGATAAPRGTAPRPGTDSAKQGGEPSPEPAKKSPPEDAGAIPDLDRLLGITKEGASEADAGDPSKKELDRMLTGAEIGDAFKQAVGLMGDAAERIQGSKDVGLSTQRVQESIIKRLDQLISSLENQQQSGSSSSSPGQQQQSSTQQVPNQAKTQQREQRTGDNTGQVNPPGRQDGPLRPGMESVRSAWGQLPERVRDMLIQGVDAQYSAIYKNLTEAYYQKLAEQGTRK
jgi:hypothetical protein